MSKIKKSKHQRLVDRLAYRLMQKEYYPYVAVESEYKYGKPDVLVKLETHDVYFEVKCTDGQKQYDKAMKQLIKWSATMREYNSTKNFYGVYVTPTYIRLAVKNGRPRKYIDDKFSSRGIKR